jgi:hypothetical protein
VSCRAEPCCGVSCCAVCAQVIDDQVDALAANAVKALGSLWGGLNTVAKTSWGLTKDITTKVGVLWTACWCLTGMGMQGFPAAVLVRFSRGQVVLGSRATVQLSHAVSLQHEPGRSMGS